MTRVPGGASAAVPAAGGAGQAPGRLPRPRTSFVGRENEIAQARHLLYHHRLLTLTGPGGCGKTRLSIVLATRAIDEFVRGVHFVSLAAIRDPSLVPVSIAQGVGLQDARGGSLLEHLSAYLGDRGVLLVLDNFEQVLSAGDFVQELISQSSQLRVLVTSRAPLHLSGEQEFPVPALRLPDQELARSAASVTASDSGQLFAARAGAALPGFTIDEDNAGAIAGIVERLEGLPLAIELAAARVKVLPPEGILARLEDSLGLLVGRGRDVPDRQRTLRAAIGWSYELLGDAARQLLAACSVFRGGISLAGVEAVCEQALELGVPALDAVQELVDHSLLRLASPSAPLPRYAMLETVREFAAEQLNAMAEAAAVHAAHAAHFEHLAEPLAPPPFWPAKDGLDVLEMEHDNFRAALDWYQHESPAAALRLANRLTAFWSARGHFSEGRARLGDLLGRVPEDDPERLHALNSAAWLATDQGDVAAAEALLEQSIAGTRAVHDPAAEGTALFFRGRGRLASGDAAGGASDISRALELQTASGDGAQLAAALWFAGLPLLSQGEVEVAAQRFERCVELSEALDLPAVGARALQLLGVCRIEMGDLSGARSALARGVPAIVDIGDRFAIPAGLGALAGLAAKEGRHRAALRLAGAAAEYAQVNHTHRPLAMLTYLDGWLATARSAVGAVAAVKLFDEGRELSADEAITLGLHEQSGDLRREGGSPRLTRREAEVADLVARGMTNRDTAAQLYLSVRTVEVHVDHILTKLGLRNRTELAAWTHEPARNT